jgi:hypothetical protein
MQRSEHLPCMTFLRSAIVGVMVVSIQDDLIRRETTLRGVFPNCFFFMQKFSCSFLRQDKFSNYLV